MRFSISLLTVICIASVIGTVLKQHEPFNNYVNQFGPFWAEVFGAVELYTVYSAWWFLLILAFLVVSTTPVHRAQHAEDHRRPAGATRNTCASRACRPSTTRPQGDAGEAPRGRGAAHRRSCWRGGGWKVQAAAARQRHDGRRAQGRRRNKLGYLAAHSAIVLVCLGGLLDGDLIVRAQMALQGKTPYAGGGMIARRAGRSTGCPPANPTFRGNLLVPEGTQRRHGDPEPCRTASCCRSCRSTIELKKFIVEYYSTGMPKLFASEIVIHDRETGEKIPARVEGERAGVPPRHRDLPVQLRRRRLQREAAGACR